MARALLISAVVLSALGRGLTAHADTPSDCAPDGIQGSGAVYRMCMPAPGEWNGDLVVFAHGYVPYNEPIAIPEDQLVLPGGLSILEMVNGLPNPTVLNQRSKPDLAAQHHSTQHKWFALITSGCCS